MQGVNPTTILGVYSVRQNDQQYRKESNSLSSNEKNGKNFEEFVVMERKTSPVESLEHALLLY